MREVSEDLNFSLTFNHSEREDFRQVSRGTAAGGGYLEVRKEVSVRSEVRQEVKVSYS